MEKSEVTDIFKIEASSSARARGSAHDNGIREFEITPKGVVLKKKFLGMEQILGGTPRKSIREKPPTADSKPSRMR